MMSRDEEIEIINKYVEEFREQILEGLEYQIDIWENPDGLVDEAGYPVTPGDKEVNDYENNY